MRFCLRCVEQLRLSSGLRGQGLNVGVVMWTHRFDSIDSVAQTQDRNHPRGRSTPPLNCTDNIYSWTCASALLARALHATVASDGISLSSQRSLASAPAFRAARPSSRQSSEPFRTEWCLQGIGHAEPV